MKRKSEATERNLSRSIYRVEIIQGMKRAGEKKSSVHLDEVDKLMVAYNGRSRKCTSRKYWILNKTTAFQDHYL